ncbi:(2Fe-2S)-binding protein [Hydrocoleum sp. CS-953]|uniref:aromatic ring-hydroxylating oxygenase subunit alpha n=1 Tax=Hydrocoleum sp. CS-953 TaxID=1671698 RepID=UPI000B9AF0FA|nr:SRPBCC family protein [Hydrocoleum sp. CS-953]OZH55074.1 (2Fe-2S)-binding protein [Hydrocoleum sp. CS-953]
MTTKNFTRDEMETVQEILQTDSRTVPPVLKQESIKNLGTADIPREIFFSQEYHNLEVEKLWKKVWQWACREENIPNVGDYVVYDVADLSVIVVRSKADKIQAFYNSCLHRGTQLCVDEGNTLALQCPFHGWTWKLDGTLAHIPCRWDFEQVEDEAFRLPEIKVATWQGFVFINFDPDCESLESYLENLPEHFQQFALQERFIAAHVAKVMPANWKVALGAFLEVYHVIGTHPQILKFSGDANSQNDIYGRHNRLIMPIAVQSPHLGKLRDPQAPATGLIEFMGIDLETLQISEEMNPRAYAAEVTRQSFKQNLEVDCSTVSDTEMLDIISYFIFPNLMIFPGVGQPFMFRFRPYGNDPDSCIMEFLVLQPCTSGVMPPAAKIHWLTSEENWSDVPELRQAGPVLDQDASNLLLLQKGWKASAKPGITLGNYQESRIRHFHQILDKYLS